MEDLNTHFSVTDRQYLNKMINKSGQIWTSGQI